MRRLSTEQARQARRREGGPLRCSQDVSDRAGGAGMQILPCPESWPFRSLPMGERRKKLEWSPPVRGRRAALPSLYAPCLHFHLVRSFSPQVCTFRRSRRRLLSDAESSAPLSCVCFSGPRLFSLALRVAHAHFCSLHVTIYCPTRLHPRPLRSPVASVLFKF